MMNLAPDAAVPALPDYLVRGLLVREVPPAYGAAPDGKAPPSEAPRSEGPGLPVDDGMDGDPGPPPPLWLPEYRVGRPDPVPREEGRRQIREGGHGQEMVGQVRAVRRVQRSFIRILCDHHDSGDIAECLFASMTDYAAAVGLSAREALAALNAGHLFEEVPRAEALFLDARLSLDAAGLLGQLSFEEGGLPTDRDWVQLACDLNFGELHRLYEDRREAREQGEPVRVMEVAATRRTVRNFNRARDLASRKAGRRLTRGEAFAHIVDDYLNRHDPMRQGKNKGRPRRRARCSLVGPYIAQAEKDRCRRRFGDRCAVAGCTNRVFLDFAHIHARALGGANRWWNLLFLCRTHHRMFDGKRMFLVGPAGGEQWFEDRKGRKVADLRAPPPEYFAAYPKRE